MFTRLQVCCSQIVTLKILNSSPGFGVDSHFLWFLHPPRAWLLPGTQISSINLWRIAVVRALSIDRNLIGGTEDYTYTCWSLFLVMSLRWSPDVLVNVTTQGFNHRPFTFCLLRFHKISRSEKYLLWNARTSWSKRIWSFLLLFPFLNKLFYRGTYRTFYDAAFDVRNTFLQHVFIPKFFWCCRP